MQDHIKAYGERLISALNMDAMKETETLARALRETWNTGATIYLCGNGGSAGNAIHIANDFTYGAGKTNGVGLRVEALPANAAVITCLGNDIGYDLIYAEQIRVKGKPGDILIVFSGSGNSPNVVKALEQANALGMQTFAILGFSGGKCKEIAQHPMHFPIDDMQIAEDLQLMVCHICMQWLYANPVNQDVAATAAA